MGPQMARNARSSLPRSRRILDACRSSLPWSRRMLDGRLSSPEPQNARRVPLEPALEPQNARRGPLEPALEPQHARKVPLEPTAVRCVRFLRSKSAVFCSSVIGLHFCSAPLCSVGLGLAGALDLAARALSASLRPRPGRAERKRTDPDNPSLPGDASQGGAADACCTPSPLGLAGALDLAARPRWGARGQSRTKTNRTRQAKLTRRRFAGQDHGCLLHSTRRRTYSVHGMHGYALVLVY